jgi:methylaspartate ammonia-lyase
MGTNQRGIQVEANGPERHFYYDSKFAVATGGTDHGRLVGEPSSPTERRFRIVDDKSAVPGR